MYSHLKAFTHKFFSYLEWGVAMMFGLIYSTSLSFGQTPISPDMKLEEQAGVWLDLATHYCEQGDSEQAQKILNVIELEFAPPPGIQALIQYLRTDGCRLQQPLRWRLTSYTGWTDNVNQGPWVNQVMIGPQQIPLELSANMHARSDAYLGAELDWTAWQSTDHSWQIKINATAKQYKNESSYSQQIVGIHATKTWQTPRYELQWINQANQVMMGGHNFLQSAQTGLRFKQGPWIAQTDLGTQLFTDYKNYNARIWLNQIGYEWVVQPNWYITPQLRYTMDQATHDRPGNDRQGPGLQISSIYIHDAKIKTEWLVRYDHIHSNAAYFPGIFDMKRQQRWQEYRWLGSYLVTPEQQITVQIFHYHVKDQVPILAFRQIGAQLSWTTWFR